MTTPSQPYYVITANHLFNGEVVFWADADQWQYLLSEAYAFDDKDDADDNLSRVRADQVVGAYVIMVEKDASQQITPTHLREAIRASGPSNYFHGKQHDRNAPHLSDRLQDQKGEQSCISIATLIITISASVSVFSANRLTVALPAY